jgi:3-dehydroquinate synthase
MSVTLTISSLQYTYTVDEVSSLGEAVAAATAGDRPHLLVDDFFATHPAFRALQDDALFVRANEESKSFAALEPVYAWLHGRRFRRNDTLVAVGGGVVQDIACFVASTFMRGVRWNFVPTTMLAQCDSCIGSKSSINLGAHKNQLGTFFPPRRIFLTDEAVKTLPPDEVRSGLGEAVKLHLLAGEVEFRWIARELDPRAAQTLALMPIVWACLRLKKPVIELDEFDRGSRNLLNYGHTFGHAFEAATSFGIPHGIAVSLGMAAATHVSWQLGLVDDVHFRDVVSVLRPLFDPYQGQLFAFRGSDFVDRMRHDKKNDDDNVTCILTSGFGAMAKRKVAPDALAMMLDAFLNELRAI